MRTTIAALGVALALGACATPAPPPPQAPDLAAAEQAIRAMDATWLAAAAARDGAGEAAMFAEDGLAYRDLADPLSGPAAYPKSVTAWTTRSIQVAASGDLAVQTGTFTETGAGPKGDKENRANFVTVWKKVGDQWKVAIDISQPIPPAAKR